MRLSRLALLCIVGVVAAACSSDKVTTPSVPPYAQLRFISAVADTGAVDIRFIDQVDLSPPANTLTFRGGTLYAQAEVSSGHSSAL